MDRLEFSLTVALVLAIAGGVGYRHFRDSHPPLQPVVVYGHSQFAPPETTPTPLPPPPPADPVAAAPLSATPTVAATPAPTPAPAVAPVVAQSRDAALQRLNHAGQARLEEVPGIGPVMAQRILAARQSRGGFVNWTELSDVPGIGDKRLEVIRNSFMLETGRGGASPAMPKEP